MSNGPEGERLQDLAKTETWQDYFAALSESLGFSLAVYSPLGERLSVPRDKAPLCYRLRSASPDFRSRCDSFCGSLMVKALAAGKPEVFTCHGKIISFALPVEYRGDKAIILGQGSYASPDDRTEGARIMSMSGLDAASFAIPQSFTTPEKARDVCDFVAGSVRRFLTGFREAQTIRKEFEGIKKVIGSWRGAAEERSETLYADLAGELSTLINSDGIALFVLDRKTGRYRAASGVAAANAATEAISISDRGEIARGLISGKPFFFSPGPSPEADAELPTGMGALYFFPIIVSGRLEGILCVADRDLEDWETRIIIAFCRKTALSVENQRLHQELYRKFDRFVTISELMKDITPIQDFNILLRVILDESAGLLRAEQGSLMLVDAETDELLLSAKKGATESVPEKLRINRGDGIAGRVAQLGEPILVEDLEIDPRTRQKNRNHYKTRSFVSVPLKIEDRIIGVLNLSDKTTGEVFDEEDLKLIQTFATHAAIVMDRNKFLNKTEELEKISITDALTGLLNRRYIQERLKHELARAERHGHQLSLLMLDIDGFKQCNDTFGHPFGDEVLRNIAAILVNTVRSMDIVARYGGDEFMVILPETTEEVAVEIAARILENLKRTIDSVNGKIYCTPFRLTTSIGIVCYPRDGESSEILYDRADQALYRAKNKGKNRIEVYSKEPE